MTDDPTLDLPGLAPASGTDSALERAARRTIAALVADGDLDLDGRGALPAQLLLTLSRAADAGTRAGRASAVAMSAAQILSCLDRLDPDAQDGGDDDDEFSRLVREFREAATGGPAATRDTTQP